MPNPTVPILFALLLPTVAVAQLRFSPTRQTLMPFTWCTAIAVGDVDGDGDADLVLGMGAANSRLLRNDGRGGFADVTAGRLPTPSPNSTRCIDLVDIDGDGDLDVVCGNDGAVRDRVYTNDGTGVFTDVSTAALGTGTESTTDQVLADFDGDGDVDRFVGDVTSRLYLNDGSGVFQEVSGLLLGIPAVGVQGTHGLAADLDGDGDLDIVMPKSGGVAVLQNLAGVFTPAAGVLPGGISGSRAVRAVDVDLDGDLDLLVDDGTRMLRNDGNLTFVDASATTFATLPSYTRAVFDVDLDGDVDLLCGGVVFLNDGSGHFTAQSATVAAGVALDGVIASACADFDGDGDVELPGLANFLTQLDTPQAPMRGHTYSVVVHGPATATPTLWGLGVSFAAAAVPVPIPGLGDVRIDLAQGQQLGTLAVSGGSAGLLWTIPSDPAFVGHELHYQAAVFAPNRAPHMSNAIRDVVH